MHAAFRHDRNIAAVWNCRSVRGISVRGRLQLTQLGVREPGFNARAGTIRRGDPLVHGTRDDSRRRGCGMRRRIAMIAI
jgi:hypothetical protein